MFDQYDSYKGMNIDDLTEKLISEGKSLDILDKIKFIKNEISNNALNNITNLALFIQDLFKRRNIDFEEEKDKDNNNNENKYSQYNDVKENLFNILSREEVNNDQNNNNELIKMDDKSNENKMEIEPISPPQKPETQPNLIQKGKEEKKEEQFTGKKRTRERKKKENEKDKEDNSKKKNKKKKENNKENENNNINNNNRGVKKEKEENIKKKRTKKDTKQNNKNNKTNNIKSILNSKINTKNDINSKKNINSNTKRNRKKENHNETKRNNRTPKKADDGRKSVKIIEEILKREFELGSKIRQQKESANKNKQINLDENKDKEKDKDSSKDNNTGNNTNTNINPRYKKSKKNGKKRYNNAKLIIDEELKKSTPIRNLKKRPKSILKKININQPNSIQLQNSTTPIKFQKAKSSEKKINLSSESKNKKFRTFAEIFQSPSKLKATPLKRRVNSEKKSNLKMNNILTAEEKSDKKDLLEKKRNISFNNERIVKEYNPKTPVRDVKQRTTRKSPLERKNRNELIK